MNTVVTDTIDANVFASALTSGIHRVIGQQELLNRINVFPVADRDTGTNLSLSLGAALSVLHNAGEKPLGALLAAVADKLLDGARGNSGAILAQFFQGMSDSACEITHFSTVTFEHAVSKGSEHARDALSRPREGTILSVIAAFAEDIAQQIAELNEADFSTLLERGVTRAEEALADTPKQLPVLQKAGVVDAGAKGFAELVGGISDFLSSGRITPLPDAALVEWAEAPVDDYDSPNASQYRYCTECLVIGNDIERRKLREELARIGDSLVLAGSKRKAKVHIHVDDPDAVFDIARRFGELRSEKADDMHRQQHAGRDAAQSFAVITDSAADIGDEDMERFDIHMVPCRIQFGDRGYLDKVSITSDEFYAELTDNPHHPTTSQPAPGDFRRQFQFLASHFDDVLSINLTSRVSGTYESARSAATRTQASGNIHVIDSFNGSTGQGQLVVLAAKCARAGWNIDATMRVIEEEIPRIRTFALVDDLRYAVRGGRAPGWLKSVADLLGISPILSTKKDGRISLGGFLFGRRNRIARFVSFLAKRCPRNTPLEIGIGQAVCPHDAQQLATALRKRLPACEKLTVCVLGTGIGVHGGPGTLIVSTRPLTSAYDLSIEVD